MIKTITKVAAICDREGCGKELLVHSFIVTIGKAQLVAYSKDSGHEPKVYIPEPLRERHFCSTFCLKNAVADNQVF